MDYCLIHTSQKLYRAQDGTKTCSICEFNLDTTETLSVPIYESSDEVEKLALPECDCAGVDFKRDYKTQHFSKLHKFFWVCLICGKRYGPIVYRGDRNW